MTEPIKLPPLVQSVPIAAADGKPTTSFVQYWSNQLLPRITSILQGLSDAVAAILAARAAAEAAQTAADTAQDAADAAATAATAAQATADEAGATGGLTASYVTGLTITGEADGVNAKVVISAHTRVYGPGSSVPVNAGAVTGLLYATDYWIAYDDPARTGGAVTYLAFTTSTDAFANPANPARHFVGAALTPALSTDPANSGKGARPPGYVEP